MVANERLPAVIVNPSTPIGPRDVRPTPTGRIIVEAARGRMPGFVDTGLNLVHVDDVAEGHIAALRRGRIGERYILGGENVLLADMLADIARLVGRRPPRCAFRAPPSFRSPMPPRRPPGSPDASRSPRCDGIRMAEHHMFFTAAKAERELGFRRATVPGGARGRDPLVPGGRISGQEAPRRRREHRAGLSPHVRIAAQRVTRLPHGGDAIGIAQRREFIGVAITRCRAGKRHCCIAGCR